MIGNNIRKKGYIYYGNKIYKLILYMHSISDSLKTNVGYLLLMF